MRAAGERPRPRDKLSLVEENAMPDWLTALPLLFWPTTHAGDGLPQAPPPRPLSAPGAVFSFPPGHHMYSLRVDIQTTNERKYAVKDMNVDQFDAAGARDCIFRDLERAGWAVEKGGELSFVIRGKKMPDGSVVPIASSKLTLRGLDQEKPSPAQPTISGLGGVTTKTDR